MSRILYWPGMGQDLKILEKIYKIDKIKLVDMFPRTKHVETVCLLSRMKINEQ